MKITWYGTASILLESEGERLLFDPFVELAGASNPNSLEDFVQELSLIHILCPDFPGIIFPPDFFKLFI